MKTLEAELLETLNGLMIGADNCFTDLKKQGNIAPPNGRDYRRFRQRAVDLIAKHRQPFPRYVGPVAGGYQMGPDGVGR